MTPTHFTTGTRRVSPTSAIASPDWLNTTRLFRDAANAEDPEHLARRWEIDQAFRTSHPALFLALAALREYFSNTSETLSVSQRQALREWAGQENPDALDRLILNNLREILSEENVVPRDRARQIMEAIGRPPESTRTVEREEGASDAFTFSSLSLGFRFDRAHRDLAHWVTVGALPAEGMPGYNQTADVGLQLDGEFQVGDFRFFGGLAWNHGIISQGAPEARIEQIFVQGGLAEYGRLLAGNPRDGFFVASGRSRVGFGIGARVCTGFTEAAAAAGAACPDAVPQLSILGDSDLLSAGYGPVELSLRLISNPYYFNLTDDSLIPSLNNLVPLEFSLSYHFRQPERPGGGLQTEITDAQAVYDGLRILGGAFQDNLSFRQEAAVEETRILNILGASGTIGAEGQYNLLNLGTFVGGLLRGVPAGTLAYELRGDLAVGTTAQRIMLAVPMALEPLVHGLIAAAASREDPAIPSLEEQAFYLSIPYTVTRDGLSILGALGAFGDRNRAVAGDLLHQVHFLGAHGALALGGLILVLASGDGSGDGFLANTILGNRRPVLEDTEISGTQWDLGSQREQYLRLTLGSMLLSYGASGIFDYLGAFGSGAGEAEETSSETNGPPLSLSVDTDGRTRGMVNLRGQF